MATKKKQPTKQPAKHQSLKKGSADPFFTFRFTQQTVYWLILSLLVLGLGIWVMMLSVKVNQIYDDIDAANAAGSVIVPAHKH
jgi:hypothetical protein